MSTHTHVSHVNNKLNTSSPNKNWVNYSDNSLKINKYIKYKYKDIKIYKR
jgi:hypothetical protein